MLKIKPSNRFKRDLKLAIKGGYDMQLLDDVVFTLLLQQPQRIQNIY